MLLAPFIGGRSFRALRGSGLKEKLARSLFSTRKPFIAPEKIFVVEKKEGVFSHF